MIDKLQNQYNYYVSRYGRTQIFGTFSVGKVNYNSLKNNEEPNFITVYVPTFEDLCSPIDYSDLQLYDIRRVYNCMTNSSEMPLEFLFSKYYFINPRYESYFTEYFYSKREELGRLNKQRRLEKAERKMSESFKSGDRVEGAKLALAATMYADGRSCADCFSLNDKIAQMMLEDVNSFDDSFFIEMMTKARKSITEDTTSDNPIREGIIAIIGESLKSHISIDGFKSQLNTNELKAFNELINFMNSNSITLSVSGFAEKHNLSKFTLQSLLSKMGASGIAKIESHGAKGTTIELISAVY